MLDPTQEPEFFVSQASEHYRPQNYRPEWESNPCLRQWLAPGRNSKRARCTYCDIEMTADICVLKSHGKGARHKRRLMGENLTSNSRYNPGWEHDPDYADWVRPGRVKTRAECRYCDVEFAAETTVLKNHAKSKRHGRAACQAKKLEEMSRVWSAEKLLVDSCSNDDPHESNHLLLSTENRRGSLRTRPLPSETPTTCTLTVDEGSSSSSESPQSEGNFNFEGRISSSDTLQFELHTTDSEPGIDLHRVACENKHVLNVDASCSDNKNYLQRVGCENKHVLNVDASCSESKNYLQRVACENKHVLNVDASSSESKTLCGDDATLRVRNAHLLRSPNTLVMTIEDSSSSVNGNVTIEDSNSSMNGNFDSCESSEALRNGVDIKDERLLEATCRFCRGQVHRNEDGQQLCDACKVTYAEQEPCDSLESWLPCKDEEESDEGPSLSPPAGGGAEGGNSYVVCSLVRSKGARNSSNGCVVQGYDLTTEVQRLVAALRSQVAVLNARLAEGVGQQQHGVLLRLDKVLGLLCKIKRL